MLVPTYSMNNQQNIEMYFFQGGGSSMSVGDNMSICTESTTIEGGQDAALTVGGGGADNAAAAGAPLPPTLSKLKQEFMKSFAARPQQDKQE